MDTSRRHLARVPRAPIAALAAAAALVTSAAVPAKAIADSNAPPRYVSSFGTCGADPSQFAACAGIAVAPNGDVFLADNGTSRVMRFDANGAFVTAWYTHTAPVGIATAADGTVWATLPEESHVVHFDAGGTQLGSIGSFGKRNGQFVNPLGVAVGPLTGDIYVSDNDNGRVQWFTAAGTFQGVWGGIAAGLPHATNLAADGAGGVDVLDAGAQQILRYDLSGRFLGSWSTGGPNGDPIQFGYGLGADAFGHLFVVDGADHVQEFTAAGQWVTTWGASGSGDGEFVTAWSVAAGPGGVVYVADRSLCRVEKFQLDGVPARGTSWGALKAVYR